MKITFIFTNYNNSSYTVDAVQSIENLSTKSSVTTIIVDNDSNKSDIDTLRKIKTNNQNFILIENNENIGYFLGLNTGLKYLHAHNIESDFIIIGNNDLIFPPDFIGNLKKAQDHLPICPVISPNLIDLDGNHQNPHVVGDISNFRILIWDLYYSNYYIARLILFIAQRFKKLFGRKDHLLHDEPGFISQGYGACYILTPLFLREFHLLSAPTFLMGEEFFLKKQIESKGYKIYYEPTIKVEHHDHATIGKVPNKKLWEIARQSHKIYKQYLQK